MNNFPPSLQKIKTGHLYLTHFWINNKSSESRNDLNYFIFVINVFSAST